MNAASHHETLSSGLKAPDDVEAGQSRGASRAPATADERLDASDEDADFCNPSNPLSPLNPCSPLDGIGL